MISYIDLKSFEDFDKYTTTIQPSGPPVFFYFSGTKDASGNSWCPDCVEDNGPKAYFFFTGTKKENGRSWCISCQLAEPVVRYYLSELQKNLIFAYVDVGDVTYWRDKNCPFRTDNRLRLMQIPTIIKWKGVQRLEGSQCNKRELLQMVFEEEEE